MCRIICKAGKTCWCGPEQWCREDGSRPDSVRWHRGAQMTGLALPSRRDRTAPGRAASSLTWAGGKWVTSKWLLTRRKREPISKFMHAQQLQGMLSKATMYLSQKEGVGLVQWVLIATFPRRPFQGLLQRLPPPPLLQDLHVEAIHSDGKSWEVLHFCQQICRHPPMPPCVELHCLVCWHVTPAGWAPWFSLEGCMDACTSDQSVQLEYPFQFWQLSKAEICSNLMAEGIRTQTWRGMGNEWLLHCDVDSWGS